MTTRTEKPKYVQLADLLRERIRNGELQVGDRLPSYAEMYRQFGATTATAQRVCDLLSREQLIERRSGSGVYVADPQRALTANIGLIFSRAYKALHNPFYAHVMQGVYEAADLHRQRLLLLGTDRDWQPDSFGNVDGLLLSGHQRATNEAILHRKPAQMPCVSMFIAAKGMTSIVADDYGAARLATRYFHQHGHRRIACLMQTSQKDQIIYNRLSGYRDGLSELGVDRDLRWERLRTVKVKQHKKQSFLDWGREQMKEWIQQDWQQLECTAILVQNDEAAVGAMQALHEAGIDVPDEVSLIGFDGTQLCDHLTPRLTSVQLPLEKIGTKAVELLLEQVRKGQCEEQVLVLPAKLRDGASVRTL